MIQSRRRCKGRTSDPRFAAGPAHGNSTNWMKDQTNCRVDEMEEIRRISVAERLGQLLLDIASDLSSKKKMNWSDCPDACGTEAVGGEQKQHTHKDNGAYSPARPMRTSSARPQPDYLTSRQPPGGNISVKMECMAVARRPPPGPTPDKEGLGVLSMPQPRHAAMHRMVQVAFLGPTSTTRQSLDPAVDHQCDPRTQKPVVACRSRVPKRERLQGGGGGGGGGGGENGDEDATITSNESLTIRSSGVVQLSASARSGLLAVAGSQRLGRQAEDIHYRNCMLDKVMLTYMLTYAGGRFSADALRFIQYLEKSRFPRQSGSRFQHADQLRSDQRSEGVKATAAPHRTAPDQGFGRAACRWDGLSLLNRAPNASPYEVKACCSTACCSTQRRCKTMCLLPTLGFGGLTKVTDICEHTARRSVNSLLQLSYSSPSNKRAADLWRMLR
ncbi:hypothetical protein QBC46DRAFT_408942 [Diplogelasinospora grovesii]|uniref:Uncharacterized protein n=1 Tax=Diplogelasinospora grovesii TaxID=303347 RepID=A0AAN6N9K8_9PEZI|nr:hypothetical protein QBC46DRAFT_408942 [Diplogelasinospora grovesii]